MRPVSITGRGLVARTTLSVVLLAAAPHGYAETEVVSGMARVVDGDTVHLSTETRRMVKVRLQGVAAPELSETGGTEATRFVKLLAEGRKVTCELDGTRSKDREVGVCFVDGKDIGAEVIGAGLARDCPRFSGGRYQALERPEASMLPYPSYCTPRRKTSATAQQAGS